jgi:hypothetical protein
MTLRRITIALWIVLVAYLAGFTWHWYTHRPCADVNGRPALLEGERVCVEERHGR